jgi:hypothetical protein
MTRAVQPGSEDHREIGRSGAVRGLIGAQPSKRQRKGSRKRYGLVKSHAEYVPARRALIHASQNSRSPDLPVESGKPYGGVR